MTQDSAPPGDPSRTRAVPRRAFLKQAAAGASLAGAASAVATGAAASAASTTAAPPSGPAAESAPTAPDANAQGNVFVTHPGSDFMVDVLKSLGIEYVAANAASSFRSLHESILNYAGNRAPQFLATPHEESSAGMAHGYYKASGRLMAIAAHGTVGLQHAAMGIYNAWCDRVPMLIFGGNSLDAARRRPGVEWYHSMQDPGAPFRDYLKWDDQPHSLQHFADSTVRAYRMAMTPPMAPTMISLDLELQEEPLHDRQALNIPPVNLPPPPVGDARVLREAAKRLVAAEKPLIVVDRATRNQDGVRALVELAESLQAPVIDLGARLNFPGVHPLWQAGNRAQLVPQADVILMLEVADPWAVLHGFGDPWKVPRRVARADVQTIHVTLADFIMKSNFQDMQRYQPADVGISADAHSTIPALTEAIRREMSPARLAQNAARTEAARSAHAAMRERMMREATWGWDARPITTGRLALEVYEVVKNENWCLQSGDTFTWPFRLWPTTQHHQVLGFSGGAGVGYTLPASIGAALANRDKGLLTVSIQPDGDFLMAPGVLWTAAHHRVPLLIVMFNNRAWAQEVMHLQRMANLHQRDPRNIRHGTEIWDPDIDYAKIAQGHGVWAEGPIEDPAKLAPALRRALAVVKSGAPALVDVVCQMR